MADTLDEQTVKCKKRIAIIEMLIEEQRATGLSTEEAERVLSLERGFSQNPRRYDEGGRRRPKPLSADGPAGLRAPSVSSACVVCPNAIAGSRTQPMPSRHGRAPSATAGGWQALRRIETNLRT
jgi:hypothetical protein